MQLWLQKSSAPLVVSAFGQSVNPSAERPTRRPAARPSGDCPSVTEAALPLSLRPAPGMNVFIASRAWNITERLGAPSRESRRAARAARAECG